MKNSRGSVATHDAMCFESIVAMGNTSVHFVQ